MREVFSRVEDNEVVDIEVYLDAKAYKEGNVWIYSVFVKFDPVNDNLEEFFNVKEELILALETDDMAYYVGNRLVGDWSEIYFYASDAKGLNAITADILKPAGYIYESNAAKDKDWEFFDFNIFPTDLELSVMQSKKIVELLEEEGDNILIPREVEHYASFNTQTQKERFVQKAATIGFVFKDDISSEEFEHGVALTKKHALGDDELNAIISPLLSFIKEEHGEYELWSTVLADSN